MLAVLFTAGYQSFHAFSHKHQQKSVFCEDSHHGNFKTYDKTFSESEDCPICDFKFVAFLSPEVLQFDFFTPFNKIPYQFKSNETCITFEGNSFYLRGPPVLV